MTLMAADAASMYFRAFYGVPTSVRAPDGRPVNAIRGFLDMVSRLITQRQPSRFVACLDNDWRPQFRVDALGSYKAHRVAPGGAEDSPEELGPQVPILLDVLAAAGLCAIGVDGFEADDVIGALAASESGPVEVVTGDRDLFQVIGDDGRVRVLYIARGVANLEVIGPAELVAKYGVHGAQYADFAVLRGDPSDGLPGVAGIGEKTAAALVSRYGSLRGIIEAASQGDTDFSSRSRAAIVNAADYLVHAPAVVAVRTDLALPKTWRQDARLPGSAADPDALREMRERYRLGSALDRLAAALGWGP